MQKAMVNYEDTIRITVYLAVNINYKTCTLQLHFCHFSGTVFDVSPNNYPYAWSQV